MSAFDSLVRHGLPMVPKFVVGAVAKRYVAGETLDDAVTTVRELNGEGSMATCDVLGEEVTEPERAERAVEEYLQLLDRIAAEDLDSNSRNWAGFKRPSGDYCGIGRITPGN